MRLSGLEKSPVVPVLLCLCGLAGDDWSVSARQADIAKMIGLSTRSVVRAFTALAGRGFISKVRRGCWMVTGDSGAHSYVTPCHLSQSYVTPCHLSQEKQSYVTPCHLSEEQSPAGHIYKELPLRGSSSAGVSTRDTTTEKSQEKVRRLEEIVTSNLGERIWGSSTNWVAVMDRAEWNLDVVTDAVIAYKEKVIDVGDRHMFSRLLNFVKMEKAALDRRYEKEQKKTERPDSSVFTERTGQRVEEIDLMTLKEFLDV